MAPKIPFINSPIMGYQFDPSVAAQGIAGLKDIFTHSPTSELTTRLPDQYFGGEVGSIRSDQQLIDELGALNAKKGLKTDSDEDQFTPVDFDAVKNPGAASIGSAAGNWYDAYNAKSQRDFLSGGANMVNNALRDVTNVSLNLAQNNILNQLQSGNEVIVRPEGLTNDVTGRSDSYLDRIFQGKDSINASDLVNNPEFVEIGKKLAIARNTASSPSGFSWTKENEDKASSLAFYDSLTQDDSVDINETEEDPKPN